MSRLTRSLSLTSTNALANFDRVVEDIGDRDLLLLLDYDGTLAPIVNDPSQVQLGRCLQLF
jgi:trehalose-6-phosphatase